MGRIKAVGRAKPLSKGLAPKSNLYVRSNDLVQQSPETNNMSIPDTIDDSDDAEDKDVRNNSGVRQDYPSPALTVQHERTADETFEINARIPKKNRKKYPADAPRISRPPYLPAIMQIGCIQTTKFKCQTAPTAKDGKPDWDVIKYCLDCLRPHVILYCDGTHELHQQDCNYHYEHPDKTLRIKEYDRVRKRLEKLYFDHGIIDSRPFTAPILQHYTECGHENEEEGFNPDALAKMKETLQWGKEATQDQLSIAAAAKVETPVRPKVQRPALHRLALPQVAFEDNEDQDKGEKVSPHLRKPYDSDVIMIED